MGLFFLTVGMGINLAAFADAGLMIVAAVIGLIALKAVLLTGLARAFRLPFSLRPPMPVFCSGRPGSSACSW